MGQPNIIGRLKTNDKYQTIYDTVDGNDMARFKHETYAYSLEKEHTLFKSLYLYHGYSRVAKADMPTGTKYLEITFSSEAEAQRWDAASEQIHNVLVEVPWVYRNFEQKWKPVAEELHRRIYAKQF